MIIPDKKKTVTVILSKLKKGGGVKDAPVLNEAQAGESSELKIIAEDMMMAFKSGSVSDLEAALDALVAKVQADDQVQDSQEDAEE